MKEKQFKAHIEAALTSPAGGLTKGSDVYDCGTVLYKNTLLSFVQETQPKAWKKYTRLVTRNPEEAFIKTFNERCSKDGLLHVLRNDFDAVGARFRVCYFRPESNLNEEHERLYRANKVEVYRQWYYSETCKNSVDMVLVLNGIPVFALELKNQLTGQNIDNARRQWKNDRDPNERCFGFNFRILSYFCVDLYEACMATKLAGKHTYFLPFNQGSVGAGKNGGAGNPAATDGDFAVSYIWREVFQRDSLMDILHRFMNLETKEEKVRRKNGKEDKVVKKTLIFPRYHQLDVVRKLIAHVKQHGSGHNYLIQHSAGSGKSNSIAWVAHRLSTLFDAENQPIFSSVIVVTDRTVLDAQLRSTISGHDHTRGVIAAIDDKKTSQDLKDAINAGARIIITTLQKFPVIYREVIHYEGRRYGIIIDEAHSSQGGHAAIKMKAALADIPAALEQYAEEEELDAEANDAENKLVQEILSQGKHDNLSFFAFTATPKDTTLQQFCEQGPDGKWHPFHVYSMRQAIEEKFILDVLQNYTTYKTCCKLIRTAAENEEMASSKAARLIRQYATLHPENIRQKSEIIVETFLETTRHKIGGKGKIEMEYYKLEETGNGCIRLAGADGVLEPGTATAGGGAADKKEPLDELLSRINEAMGGNFTEANKVAARTIMAVLKENASLAASARSSNMKVFMDTIFKDIFERAAMDCYVKSMEGFEDLMQDDYKRDKLRAQLAQELYRQFRSEYSIAEEPVLKAAED